MKSIVLLVLMVFLASVLAAANEPGALELREDDNFWRLTYETSYGGSWPNGDGGNSNSSYYYNAIHPSQLDSLVEVVSTNFLYTMKHFYTREDFADYYQITIDKGYNYGQPLERIINRYNYQELLLEMLVYNIDYTTNQLDFSYRNEYTYDNSGNRCTTGQLVERNFIGKQTAGEHTAAIPSIQLSSGVYLLRIEAGLSSQTTKFLVLK